MLDAFTYLSLLGSAATNLFDSVIQHLRQGNALIPCKIGRLIAAGLGCWMPAGTRGLQPHILDYFNGWTCSIQNLRLAANSGGAMPLHSAACWGPHICTPEMQIVPRSEHTSSWH